MADDRTAARPRPVDSDLVEYLIVSVPDLDSVGGVAAALTQLVDAGTIRLLDLVAIETAAEGEVTVVEPESIDSMAALVAGLGNHEGMLSERDLLLASTALVPGTAAVVLVAEDHWAEKLSDAARRAGGRVIAGERLPRLQVEAALANAHRHETEEH